MVPRSIGSATAAWASYGEAAKFCADILVAFDRYETRQSGALFGSGSRRTGSSQERHCCLGFRGGFSRPALDAPGNFFGARCVRLGRILKERSHEHHRRIAAGSTMTGNNRETGGRMLKTGLSRRTDPIHTGDQGDEPKKPYGLTEPTSGHGEAPRHHDGCSRKPMQRDSSRRRKPI